jgi:hypothetical protein
MRNAEELHSFSLVTHCAKERDFPHSFGRLYSLLYVPTEAASGPFHPAHILISKGRGAELHLSPPITKKKETHHRKGGGGGENPSHSGGDKGGRKTKEAQEQKSGVQK